MVMYYVYIYVTLSMSLIPTQESVIASGDGNDIESRACNTTTGAGCPTSGADSSFPSFLFKLVLIAGSIAGAMILLSAVACVCHCVHSRKTKGLLEVEATEFEQSEDPQNFFRRMDNATTNRIAASVFSWGSEFSVEGERKGNYENPEVIAMVRLNRKSNGQIYANTHVENESSLPQDETSFSTTQTSQYANVSSAL